MNINQRGTGNKNILKEIQQASKMVSQRTGLAEAMRIFPDQPKVDESKLGAAASLGLNKRASVNESQQREIESMFSSAQSRGSGNGTIKFDLTKSAVNRILSDIDSLNVTKEYFNAIQSLLSLYALGSLDNTVLDRMNREDINEVRGILREFKSILDSY